MADLLLGWVDPSATENLLQALSMTGYVWLTNYMELEGPAWRWARWDRSDDQGELIRVLGPSVDLETIAASAQKAGMVVWRAVPYME